MVRGIKECDEQNEKLRKEVENTNRELKQIKEEIMKEDNDWKMERKQLEDKVAKLEDGIEARERRENKNNIVIKNMEINDEKVT